MDHCSQNNERVDGQFFTNWPSFSRINQLFEGELTNHGVSSIILCFFKFSYLSLSLIFLFFLFCLETRIRGQGVLMHLRINIVFLLFKWRRKVWVMILDIGLTILIVNM